MIRSLQAPCIKNELYCDNGHFHGNLTADDVITFVKNRQGKHRLALANISGAMMIQATVPIALELFVYPLALRSCPGTADGLAIAKVLSHQHRT